MVKRWQEWWFYSPDLPEAGQWYGLPAFSTEPPMWNKNWANKVSKSKTTEVDRLMAKIRDLQEAGLTRIDLITTWVRRRI